MAKRLIDIGEVEIPNGDLNASLKFLNDMTRIQGQVTTEYRAAMSKISVAQSAVANRILDDESASDKQFAVAARLGLSRRLQELNQATVEEQVKLFRLVKRQIAIGLDNGLQRTDVSTASTLVNGLESLGNASLACEACDMFASMLKDVNDPQFKGYAELFEGTARRLGLLGNQLELSGKLVDGGAFDWFEIAKLLVR